VKLIADGKAGLLYAGDRTIPCSIGKSGLIAAADKKEGDGASPIGVWPLRGVLLRPDRVTVTLPAGLQLPWRWTTAGRRLVRWCGGPRLQLPRPPSAWLFGRAAVARRRAL